MKIYLENQDKESIKYIEIKFSSAWKIYILSHLATMVGLLGIGVIFVLIGALLGW